VKINREICRQVKCRHFEQVNAYGDAFPCLMAVNELLVLAILESSHKGTKPYMPKGCDLVPVGCPYKTEMAVVQEPA
jgi:hypothetical protein